MSLATSGPTRDAWPDEMHAETCISGSASAFTNKALVSLATSGPTRDAWPKEMKHVPKHVSLAEPGEGVVRKVEKNACAYLR